MRATALFTPQRRRAITLRMLEKQKQTAKAWFESEHTQVVPEATHYYADYIAAPVWARANRMEFLLKVGRHAFFKEHR